MCDSGKGETFSERSKKEQSARKISRYARNDGMGEWITHVPYKGYVGKTSLPQRHPERSRGIFLAGGDNVVCVKAENGNPSAKEARKRGKGETFCERSKKEQSARKISRCARNDGMGDGFISCSVQRICLESAIPASSSRAKPRDLSCTPV